MPYWIKVTVNYTGKTEQVQSHAFDGRDEAYAELEKIKKAQALYRTGSVDNPAPYDEALKELPGWLALPDVGSIVAGTVEGSG